LSRVPDDGSVLGSSAGERADHLEVTRGADRRWAFVYSASGEPLTIHLANLRGPILNAWWYNPRDGRTYDAAGRPDEKPFGQFTVGKQDAAFDPPGAAGEDRDWVLVLDDASQNYPPPGRRVQPTAAAVGNAPR
jgi:hypothetical protein